MSRNNEPPELTEEEKSSLENFFRHWQVSCVEIGERKSLGWEEEKKETGLDFAEFVKKIQGKTAKVKLVFRKKRVSSEKLTPNGDEWNFDNTINQVRLFKYSDSPSRYVELTTNTEPYSIRVPGIEKFLKERYQPPEEPGEKIFDDRTLDTISNIAQSYDMLLFCCKNLMESLQVMDIKPIGRKAYAINQRKQLRERVQAVIKGLGQESDEESRILKGYEDQIEGLNN